MASGRGALGEGRQNPAEGNAGPSIVAPGGGVIGGGAPKSYKSDLPMMAPPPLSLSVIKIVKYCGVR